MLKTDVKLGDTVYFVSNCGIKVESGELVCKRERGLSYEPNFRPHAYVKTAKGVVTVPLGNLYSDAKSCEMVIKYRDINHYLNSINSVEDLISFAYSAINNVQSNNSLEVENIKSIITLKSKELLGYDINEKKGICT
jgi:hypothetical protein